MKNTGDYQHNGMAQISSSEKSINLYFPDINVNTQVFFNLCYITK